MAQGKSVEQIVDQGNIGEIAEKEITFDHFLTRESKIICKFFIKKNQLDK